MGRLKHGAVLSKPPTASQLSRRARADIRQRRATDSYLPPVELESVPGNKVKVVFTKIKIPVVCCQPEKRITTVYI